MADKYSASIKIPRRFITGEVAKAVTEELGIDDDSFKEALGDAEDGIWVYEADEARGGQFEELEELLVQHGVPFDRNSGCHYSCAPLTRMFRPSSECGRWRVDSVRADDEGGNAYVKASYLETLLNLAPEDVKNKLEECLFRILTDKYSSLIDWELGNIKPAE